MRTPSFWLLPIVSLVGCQQLPPAPDYVGVHDGVYHGVRTLVAGRCNAFPMAVNLLVRGDHYQARDGGMIFDVAADGSINSHGTFYSTGGVNDGHLQVTLQGAGDQRCIYAFDAQRSARPNDIKTTNVPTPQFDGSWTASTDAWSVSAEVHDGKITGQILRCFNTRTRAWSGAGPKFFGSVSPSGLIMAETVDRANGWTHRTLSGTLPTLSISAEVKTSLDCPDTTVLFTKG